MAVYAIGDLQGCYDPFRRLLDEIRFDAAADTLWLTGDLVNRGPKSLKTLRYVKSLGDAVITVLGNHDLHLLALAAGKVDDGQRFDSLQKILKAPDRDELLHWLRFRPLVHYDAGLATLMSHAGIHPDWSAKEAVDLAGEVEAVLQGDHYKKFLGKMYGNTPRAWSEKLEGYPRLRFIVNCMTRMRMLTKKGALNFSFNSSPFTAQNKLHPWFSRPRRAAADTRVIFGHWSALGLIVMPKLVSLDTGCVWGRQLTAVRIDERIPRIYQVEGQDA